MGDSPKKRVYIWAGPQSSLDSSGMASEEKRGLLPAEEKGREGRSSDRERTTVTMDHLNVPILVPLVDYLTRFLPRMLTFKVLIYILTFITYTSYHLSRKPFSVVKVVLCPLCVSNTTIGDGWPPFDGDNGKTLLGIVDYSWLFSYAVAMYFSGAIADRVNLRFFLTLGMLGSSISVLLLGVAYYANIHHIGYFIAVQVFGGIMQSTGWPGVVSVMSHWFGKQRRGLIMGIWNAHTSLGNILGTIIPSFWANPTTNDPNPPWGLSFVVPSLIMAGVAMLVFTLLVVDPKHVGLQRPVHHVVGETRPITHTDVVDDHNTDNEDGAVSIQRPSNSSPEAVGFLRALMIPGVIEYALALFFNKLVSYTFLFWLPFYVKESHKNINSEESDWLATLFDVGGILGGIATGVLSDILKARAVSCVLSLILAVPSLFLLRYIGDDKLWLFIVLLVVCGTFINGPYAIITTAVSSDLGTDPTLRNNQNAKATVTAIIDGTGSLGAALGPLLIGLLTDAYSWNAAFYLLMLSCFLSALLLVRLFVKEAWAFIQNMR